jgi:hypothetical protein
VLRRNTGDRFENPRLERRGSSSSERFSSTARARQQFSNPTQSYSDCSAVQPVSVYNSQPKSHFVSA